MIKPLTQTMQLSSAKPRTGLQSVADLIPRLIQQYEMQAELARKLKDPQPRPNIPVGDSATSSETQVTFSWYE